MKTRLQLRLGCRFELSERDVLVASKTAAHAYLYAGWHHQQDFANALCGGCMIAVRALSVLVWLNVAMLARSQTVAPDSLGGSLLTIAVANGLEPFESSGTYRLFFSLEGTNYNMLGRAGPLASGGCNYSIRSPNIGEATLVDAQSGLGVTLSLTFVSPTNGTVALTNANGFQTGMFTMANYAGTTPPRLFLPVLAGTRIQSYLSGQPGFGYAIEISTNLVHWQPWMSIALSDLTISVSDVTDQKACFYRARPASTAFAPVGLTNQTFNLTIREGKSPLATNGICQWLTDTNDSAYQIIGGPGTSSSSGNYTYSRIGPNSSLLSCQDSVAGTLTEQLFFTSPQSGYFYSANSAGYEAGTFTTADGKVEFLGHVKFVPDNARAGSLHFSADGSPASLSVTNADGWIWTLNLPADALLTPRVITMTPFTNVDASVALLPVAAGVQLSPDGLQFSDGVTLTAKSPSPLGAHATLWMAQHDGSAMYLVPTTNHASTYTTTLFHFSSIGATDPSDPQWNTFRDNHLPQAQAAYQSAIAQCKSLERLVTVPPEPPDYDYQCDPTEQDAQIDAYQQALFAKERDALQKLFASARSLQLLGEVVSPSEFSIALELIESAMYRKVDLLFSANNQNPKKLLAVARIALNTMRQDQLLGGTGRPDWIQQLGSWGLRAIDYYLDQVRNEHKYSKVSAVFQLAHSTGLLGVDIDLGDLENRVDKALRFKMTLDINGMFKSWDSEGTIDKQINEEAKDSVTVQGSTRLPFPITTNYISLVSGTWVDFTDKCSYNLDPGQSSVWHTIMKLQPCAEPPMVVFYLVGPYPDSIETWTGCEQVSWHDPWLGVMSSMAIECHTGNGSGGLYRFPLTDGEPEVVNESFQGDSSTDACAAPFQRATSTLQLQIQHDPQ